MPEVKVLNFIWAFLAHHRLLVPDLLVCRLFKEPWLVSRGSEFWRYIYLGYFLSRNGGYPNQLHQALSGSGSPAAPSNSYQPNTPLTRTYGGSTATASAYISVGFTAGATHGSTTTNDLSPG